MGAQKNRLIETVLLSTRNICFGWEIRKLLFCYALLTKVLTLRCDSTSVTSLSQGFIICISGQYTSSKPNVWGCLDKKTEVIEFLRVSIGPFCLHMSKLFHLIEWDFVCLFDLIHYIQSTNFQLCRDGSSWVEPVLKLGLMCLAQGPQRSEAGEARTRGPSVSSTLPLSHCTPSILIWVMVEAHSSVMHWFKFKCYSIWAAIRQNLSSGFPIKQALNQSPQLQRLASKLKVRL